MATLAGVAYPTLSRIEQGHVDPRLDTAVRVGRVLGLVFELAEDRSVVRLADAVKPIDGSTVPDWTRLRALVDHLETHPELVGVAIAAAPSPSGSTLVDNVAAAVAERSARNARIQPPRWARKSGPLDEPWYPAGTPDRRARFVAEAPPEFAARNVLLPLSALWREREAVAS